MLQKFLDYPIFSELTIQSRKQISTTKKPKQLNTNQNFGKNFFKNRENTLSNLKVLKKINFYFQNKLKFLVKINHLNQRLVKEDDLKNN